MSFLDRFEKKKKDLPAGARPATRKRRSSAGGGVDEGYLLHGTFYSFDSGATHEADYSEPARCADDSSSSYSRGSSSYDSHGPSYGSSSTAGYGSDSGSPYSAGASSYSSGGSSSDSGSSGSSGSSSSSSSDSGGGSCGSSD